MKFGKLTVVKQGEDFIYPSGRRVASWYVYCDCDKSKLFRVRQKDLINGHTKSCGCLKGEWMKNNRDLLKQRKRKKKFNKYDLSGDYAIGYSLNGLEFYFDKCDYEKIKNYTWSVAKRDGYVSTIIDGKNVRLHRFLMNITNPNVFVDHINHNTSDNRKENLRLCSNTENCRNTKIGKNNTSGTTGVHYDKEKHKWASTIKYNRKTIFLGRYDDINEAINARKEAEIKYFGEFANRN